LYGFLSGTLVNFEKFKFSYSIITFLIY
jgi:hypothetical protein